MARIHVVILCVCSSLGLVGCYTPSATYRHIPRTTPANPKPDAVTAMGGGGPDDPPPKSTRPYDPADGEVALALAASTVAFPKPDKDASCAKGPNATDTYAPDDVWLGCLSLFATPTVAPHASSKQFYFAWFGNGLNMSITPYESDPFLPKTVKPGYKNPTADTVKRVGAEAATGAALGGWVGAAVAVGAGEAAAEVTQSDSMLAKIDALLMAGPKSAKDKKTLEEQRRKLAALPHFSPGSWNDLVSKNYLCADSTATPPGVKFPSLNPTVRLPVAIDTDNAMPTSPTPGCWHQFPIVDGPQGNQGWLYRFVEDDKADEHQPMGIPIYRAGNWAAAKDQHPDKYPANDEAPYLKDLGLIRLSATGDLFQQTDAYYPAAACHAVILEIAWWQAGAVVARKGGVPNQPYEIPNALKFHVTVADPTLIQPMQLTKGQRTITVYPCGAVASGTPGSNVGADISDASWTAIKNLRDAQATYAKDHAK